MELLLEMLLLKILFLDMFLFSLGVMRAGGEACDLKWMEIVWDSLYIIKFSTKEMDSLRFNTWFQAFPLRLRKGMSFFSKQSRVKEGPIKI